MVANSDVVTATNSDPETAAIRVAKNRGKPQKKAATQHFLGKCRPFFWEALNFW